MPIPQQPWEPQSISHDGMLNNCSPMHFWGMLFCNNEKKTVKIGHEVVRKSSSLTDHEFILLAEGINQ